MKRATVRRLDPWTELELSARAALRQPGDTTFRAGTALVAERCAFVFVEGETKPFALTLNALKNLALAWRDVPPDAAPGFQQAIAGVVDALQHWPTGLRASTAEIATSVQTRRERTRAAANTRWRRGGEGTHTPWYIEKD